MRRRTALAIGILSLLVLTGCASGAGEGDVVPLVGESTPTASDSVNSAAQVQAQAWLDAAVLPPGATRSSYATGRFQSHTGWPCLPVVQLEAFWTVPGWTVGKTYNWLMAHPTADLVSTAGMTLPEDTIVGEANIGYIPADDSQQGIVYTIAKNDDGVGVRAEIAALTASAVCPSLPPGETMGKPGQG